MEKFPDKKFLYHMVPKDMRGDVLHPLNTLKDTHPDLYELKAGKYEDRQHIMEQFIPTLQAAWNDVLHFSPLHPADLKEALIEAGFEPKEMRFFQVDPQLLDLQKTTIYLYPEDDNEDKMNSRNFEEFNPGTLSRHAAVPERTKKYFTQMAAEGKHPLLFVGVPHVLHKGSLDVSNLPVITV